MQTQEFLPGTQIEVINDLAVKARYRAALFDFDGTLSLIREGWQDVMIPTMVDTLAQVPVPGTREEIERDVREFVTRLTGEQTIYQMIELADQVAKRGGTPCDPAEYKRRYCGLLLERIRDRYDALESGRARPEEMLVPGAEAILAALRDRGLVLYCASGTDEHDMRVEAEMLGIAQYFDGGLFGAQEDYRSFSKAKLIQRIFREHGLRGAELVTFGDGYVEIQNTKDVGGTAVGVATDEKRGRGMDAWKRDRLIQAGADVIIPDFGQIEPLIACLFREDSP